MKTVTKKVYYCDYCNARKLSAHAMKLHEERCTNNPDRECRLCENSLPLHEKTEALKKSFKLLQNDDPHLENFDEYKVEWTAEPITLYDVKDLVDYCPICTLALLRQTGMNRHYFNFNFDYKGETNEWFQSKRNYR